MSLRLIIFDLDGTLVDTAEDIREALNRAIELLGLRPVSLDETTALVGEGTTRLIEKAIAPLGDRADAAAKEAALKKFLDYYSENLVVHSKAYPGVKETLRKLGSFERVVLSNKREALSRRLLQELGLAKYFSLIAGSDTTSSRKPSPEPVLYMLEKTGTRPEDALMVGDSPYDIAAAAGAGVEAVAVTYGYRERELLKSASHIIDDFGELIPVLLKLNAITEKRREPRYVLSSVYRDYVEIKLREKDIDILARLLDFSRNGFMVETPVPLEPGFPVTCELSIPQSFSQVICITGTVKHSEQREDRCIAGIKIKGVSSDVWFRVFARITEFIKERGGSVY